MSQERLRWASDQCPLPWSDLPSLHHTHWYALGRYDQADITFHNDGQTITVLRNRIISWHRSFTTNQPPTPPSRSLITVQEWLPKYQPAKTPGWVRFGQAYTCAYAKLHPDYSKDWRSHAKRYLKIFQRSGCTLRLGTKADVIQLYSNSQVPKSLQTTFLKVLDKHLGVHPDTIDILVVEKHGTPIACYVTGNCDEAKMSEYIIGAFHPAYAKDHAMIGLVDWWYRRSLEKDYTTLTFGHMEPPSRLGLASGNGYSFFKMHFGVTRIWLPKNHWQIKINHKGVFAKQVSTS